MASIALRWFRKSLSPEDKALTQALKRIVGFTPNNLELYKLSLRHSSSLAFGSNHTATNSSGGGKNHNERLEYLGDAFLGAIVAEYLFKKFPFKDEGFLTEIRSRLVNRESLSGLALKIGIEKLLKSNNKSQKMGHGKSMHGDALEALIGAIYLDKGFPACKKFVLEKLIDTHINIDSIVTTELNYKSKAIEWAQKEGKKIHFEVNEPGGKEHFREFNAKLFIDGEVLGQGKGVSKKKAEQAAAMNFISSLDKK